MQRPVAAGKANKRTGVLDEHHQSGEEIPEIQVNLGVGVGFLFRGKGDVQPHRHAPDVDGAAIGGLHNARPATSDDGKTSLGQ